MLGFNSCLIFRAVGMVDAVAYPGFFFGRGRGIQKIQLRTEGRENGDLRAVAP
jgi:hypothetical protein